MLYLSATASCMDSILLIVGKLKNAAARVKVLQIAIVTTISFADVFFLAYIFPRFEPIRARTIYGRVKLLAESET